MVQRGYQQCVAMCTARLEAGYRGFRDRVHVVVLKRGNFSIEPEFGVEAGGVRQAW